MSGKRKRPARAKDLTHRYLAGDVDEGMERTQERFGERSARAVARKMEQTALLRAAEAEADGADGADVESLPVGRVVQVYSLFSDVEGVVDGVTRLCVVRKTLAKLSDSLIVVGDLVRFRETGVTDDRGRPEAVIEQVLPRATLLTRSDSFKGIEQHPIVANAEQMLIVASILEPRVKWGLVDRMLVAAKAGGLAPVLCLNKMDLARGREGDRHVVAALEVLSYNEGLGVSTLKTSLDDPASLDALRRVLAGRTTVLAGHSGVGKSSLIRAIQPSLDLRVAAISGYTGKGRHTTTSARRYPLEGEGGGHVIDTPGVKLFGLWGVTPDNLAAFFPDVAAGTAPDWRVESYERIAASLSGAT